VTAPPGWQREGACREVGDPELWFSTRAPHQREAATVCAGCPVRDACLAYALSWRTWTFDSSQHDRPVGVWGGWLFPHDTSSCGKAPHPVLRPPRSQVLVGV